VRWVATDPGLLKKRRRREQEQSLFDTPSKSKIQRIDDEEENHDKILAQYSQDQAQQHHLDETIRQMTSEIEQIDNERAEIESKKK